MGSVCVSSCRWCVFVHPVAIRSAMFCVICSLCLMLVVTYGGNVLAYGSCYRFVCCEYRFPHVVDFSALSIRIILRAFVVVISMCMRVWGRESVLVLLS